MHIDPAIRIRLEIHSQNPVRGLLAVEQGDPRAFDGWLQLISALSDVGPLEPATDKSAAGGASPVASPPTGA